MKSFNLLFFPEQASSVAHRVDALYFFLVGVTGFFIVLIFLLVVTFSIKYRRSRNRVATQIHSHLGLELFWTAVPFVLSMCMFVWGATLYFDIRTPPAGAEDIYVVGKQWMWKFQHPEGLREINQLHVPLGRTFRLTMTSEDVIHDLFVPAFRVKQDVLPGRYVDLWFTPTKVGEFHLFCSQYCGTEHSKMIGHVVVMEPAQYEKWLSGDGSIKPMTAAGEQLFVQHGCQSCHNAEANARCPLLTSKFGSQVLLKSGKSVAFDEGYIRESMLDPMAKIAAGYEPVMPTYRGLISEDGIMQIIAYLKSTGASEPSRVAAVATQPSSAPHREEKPGQP